MAGAGAELGPGVAEALARTARLLRDDADALDALAGEHGPPPRTATGCGSTYSPRLPRCAGGCCAGRAAAGCPATELFAVHVEAVDALLTDWRGQAGVDYLAPAARRAGAGTGCSARGLWQA